MTLKTAKVVFMPSGRRGEFPLGTPLLQAAQQLGIDIDSICGGRGLCGRCQVLCMEGDFPKLGIRSSLEHLNAFTETEQRYEKRRAVLLQGRRLSCHTYLQGDVVIDVPPDSQVHQPLVRKEAEARDIVLDSAIQLCYIEVEIPDMHHPKGDLQRVYEALEQDWHLKELRCELSVLQQLQPLLNDGKRALTVAVYQQKTIIAAWAGFRDKAFGVAVDVGSTTIALHLCDLLTGTVKASASRMNPQIRFGEDLMSRVSYVMMQPDGTQAMSRAVRDALDDLVGELATKAGIERNDILEMSFVANPIMHHLLLGISPVELGSAPFALATNEAVEIAVKDLAIQTHPNARAYILPCIAGHVGADAAGVVLAEEPYEQTAMTLLVDVGTNAEIVLGNRARLVACSSPTGPAFEGAQISCGQRAAPGAIERVRIDPVTKEPRFKVIGSDLWSDEVGFAESVAQIGVNGICGSGIIEVIAEMYLAGIISTDGVIDGSLAETTTRIVPQQRTWSYVLHQPQNETGTLISITQNDVRQIQLAKAALYAGVRLLMDKLGIEQVERIRLAGAFGSHIDVKHAMVLGLIPDCPLAQVSSAGNAAGTGARIALLNQAARRQIEQVVLSIEKIETAVEPKFQEYFVDAMAFPHKTDPFPHLFSVVERPAAKEVVESDTGKRRRRRA
ncbi:ASKHA domain-containing protein [Thiolinea disciformis]|uniref:ASKHA domain-containing protein n=1 Tax=Thiolinea disciformis TaxID=125614 RepID=UPI000380AD37|nr:ASKHA domain-containing protein [Thiolinea disciformis]